MKKILYILYMCLVTYVAKAQEQSDPQVFLGTAAVDYKSDAANNNLQIQIQVGSGVLSGSYYTSSNLSIKPTTMGFPYSILYIASTFHPKGGLAVSKGYYTNRINIKWTLSANQEKIEKINIYRKELGSVTPVQLIGSVSKDVFEYDDTQIEGGVLYEYKIEAVGVSPIEELYTTFIEGIGFRNPTATVSGSISYDGGSPVQDVIVFAEANGAENNSGSSLQFTKGFLEINDIEYEIPTNQLTLQTWVTKSNYIMSLRNTRDGNQIQLNGGKYVENGIHKIGLNLIINDKWQTIHLSGSYPTGEIDNEGNDVFENISSLTDTTFIHISAVFEQGSTTKFYLNGREITQTYIDGVSGSDSIPATDTEAAIAAVLKPTVYISERQNYVVDTTIDKVTLGQGFQGGGYTGHLDEVRIWQRALSAKEIRRDFRRYLSGAETDLSIYLRMDEKEGNNVYDFSRKGFRQNKNDGFFGSGVVFSSVTPTKNQLGVFGVTDANGSYAIASIGYSGTGESFIVTPSFGVHAFEPASQTVFLGAESSVVNQLNFKDISSFKFNGRAVYNVQNVFNAVDEDAYAGAQIEDYGYNQYRINGTEIINKGEYYYEGGSINSTNNLYEGGSLKQYPVVGLEKALVYIDGVVVINEDNVPVETDAEGNFSVSVPIGKHKIEVRKDGHTFSHTGFFPASGSFDFFEDQISPRWFIDTTRISLIGRVVGGKIESDKPIGFGLDGAFEFTNEAGTEDEEKEMISSTNNIGVANIILKGKSVDVNTFEVIIPTNPITGEYSASLIPFTYFIKAGDVKIPSNSAINNAIATTTESLKLSATPVLDSIKYTTKDGTELFSKPFHYKKSFRYNSPVSLKLITQQFEEEYSIGDTAFDVSTLEVPLYLQNNDYSMVFEVTQNYTNKDDVANEETKEYYNEGRFNINNNLAPAGDPRIKFAIQGDVAQYLYTFQAAKPNPSADVGFANTISIAYILADDTSVNISNEDDVKLKGIVVGAIEPEGTTFVTVAPEVPDIILRDPPGSNSFATIEKGTTISFQKSNSSSEEGSVGGGLFVSVGPTFESNAGTPFFTVGLAVSAIGTADTNFSKTQQLNEDGSSTETYEFNKTISTSDDPNDVGADADIYIGNAKNEYYGICNKTFITTTIPTLKENTEVPYILVKDANGNDLYISFKEDYFVAEQPTNTFFIYTQRHIIETLIPNLITKGNTAPETVATTSTDPEAPKTRQFYLDQVDSWQKIIQNNERDKYLALKERETLEAKLTTDIEIKNIERQARLTELKDLPFILQQEYDLTEFDSHQVTLNNLFTDNFQSNISIDAGVGEFTSSVSTSIITSKSYTKTIDMSTEFIGQLGLLLNDVGAVGSITGTSSLVDETGFSTDEDLTATISYTLKDNDEDNFLAIDIVNLFDGFGPIFITKGGATSCPNEKVTISNYYNNIGFDEALVGTGGEELNAGTVAVYQSEIGVEGVTTLTDIPENSGALFNLILKNTSVTKSDLEYIIEVDALTLNGATTNIETNGVNVYIPFNETIEFPFEVYKTSASSTFKYDNIRVYLKSPCDGLTDSDTFIDVSVEFKPSCSEVTVSAPQNNFIFNRTEAYSKDAVGTITTNTLPITFTDFNTNFASFKKIELQYRNASSANWIKFKTYYGTEEFKITDGGNADDIVIEDSDSEFTYNWDIIGEKIPDGNYEFKAVSYCTADVTFESDIVTGVINLNAPIQFGTPQPSDGILDVGEDISLRFNEAIFEGGATHIKVTGLSNQQEIDHSVSVFLDGGANQIELPNQILPNGSFTLQFWFKNGTTASGNLISQENGINATLNGSELTFSLGGKSVKASIDPSQYNFYSLVYQTGANPQLLIFENGAELALTGDTNLTSDLDFNSNSSIFIGGNNVKGSIHDLRFWSKTFTPAQATVAKDKTLTGRELNLLGYWILDGGNGKVGIDKAKSRNAIVNLDWDIKPKGTGYVFENNAYLSLENVGFVQPTEVEDITLSFWIKTATASVGTIFSNGRGNDDESEQSNGFRNKWSINMKADGNLELLSENISYNLTNVSVADDSWHHVALVVKRGGSINAYVDALETNSVSSENIGGISGGKIIIGARLFEDFDLSETIDNHFTGNLDEIRLWNTARSFEQIKRDRYYEIEPNSEGLLLYTDFNQEDGNTTKGPKYNHLVVNNAVSSTFSILSAGSTQNYTQDSPPLKPKLNFTNIPFSTVINGDQMIITPKLSSEEWSLFEGQILDFSVSRMNDTHFNEQLSPITWSALVSQQEVEWFTINQTKEIITEKYVNEVYSFTMDIVNKAGSNHSYTISGLPTWITVDNIDGNVAPNATKQVVFNIDQELAMGIYNADIYLETGSGYNDALTLSLRVITPAPDWSVNVPDYSNSINVIGKIKINEVFSRDQYTKIGAFVDDKPRGEAYLKYDTAFDSYFVYLTAYSNVASGEELTFKIWDALNGKVLIAAIDGAANTLFLQNEVLGSKTTPVVFSGAQFSEQTTDLNKGWTWTSFFVEHDTFINIKATFDGLILEDNDQIKSQNEFTRYENNDWFGSLTALENTKMYKVKLANENLLKLIGNDVDETDIHLAINEGWNWLPFPIHRNIQLDEALSFYNPTDGDVIKDQYNFAIYDANSGWSGTLNYMQSNRGYMMKSGVAQTLNYPNSNHQQKSNNTGQEHTSETIAQFAKYSANMSVVAEVIANSKFNTVLVYDAIGVLRGISPIVTLNEKRMSFIAVFSNTNDALKFVISDGNTEVDVTTSFVFENNKVFGNLKNPVVLNAKSLSTEDEFLSNVVVYPNPFSNSLIINASLQTDKVTKIEIFNTIGMRVSTISTNKDITTVDTSNLAKGVYLMKLSASNGKSIIKKIVKK